jgi:ribokinase
MQTFRFEPNDGPKRVTIFWSLTLCGAAGKAANVAYAAHRLGSTVMLIGHVGDDDLAEQALSPLRQLPLDLRFVSCVRGKATGFVTILVTPDGKKTMIAAHNANDVWTEKEAANAVSAVAKAAAGSILVADCAISIDPVERAGRAAVHRKFPIILDPSPAQRVPDRLFPLVEFVTPNPVEAQQLTGMLCSQSKTRFAPVAL